MRTRKTTAMAEEEVQRRLAAILIADVAGYSRLMEADETSTLARLKALRREIVEPAITNHRGRIIKVMGDGALVEFASAVDAVRCAVAIQGAVADRTSDERDDRRIAFRIGINLGDVIVEGDDVYGDGVNVAARLEALAEPGGVCIADVVQRSVAGRVDIAFEDLGPQTVKNMERPVHAYRVVRRPPAGNGPAQVAAPAPPSIAVLPFTNMSGDPEQDYFADGIAEDITTALSHLRWFHVVARNSSFTYKGRAVDVRTIGRELGVRYVLEGSVRKAGDRLRITAQLIETVSGNHLWAEKYDSVLADMFDLQDQITAAVAGAIEPSIRQAEIERARRKRPDSLDAYDLYLRALPHAWTWRPEEATTAIALLEEALRIDPTYVAARALAAWCYDVRFVANRFDQADRTAAIRHARAVLATNTDDPDALCMAGFVIAHFERDYPVAVEAASRALALAPASANVLRSAAIAYVMAGRFEDGMDFAHRFLRLSPRDPMRYIGDIAIAYAHFFSGRNADAATAAQRAIAINPNFLPGHALLAAAQSRLGRTEETQAAVRRLLQLEPSFTVAAFVGHGRFSDALNEEYAAALRLAGLPE